MAAEGPSGRVNAGRPEFVFQLQQLSGFIPLPGSLIKYTTLQPDAFWSSASNFQSPRKM
jgi:L,D-peptidoglycan transpeptidase YkuD (ErfK/YbiS/YcfS/YnhG family)